MDKAFAFHLGNSAYEAAFEINGILREVLLEYHSTIPSRMAMETAPPTD